MSKIQEALKAMRDTSAGEGRKDAPRPKLQGNLAQRAARHGGVEPNELISDMKPLVEVSIDVDKLVQLRMLPGHAEEAQVSRQFRRIKRPILQLAFDDDLPVEDNANVVMLASALPGSGKSFCALNLARSIAMERDFGVVLVDADVLKPGISRALGLQDEKGLIDCLLDPDLDVAEIIYGTDMNDMIVVPAGQGHPEATELLASRRMQSFIQGLAESYPNHVIVFDTPPLLLTSEAQVLAEQAGQIVLVVEDRKSSQDSLIRTMNMLDRSKPINAILNKAHGAPASGYHSDDYGYYSSKAFYARTGGSDE